MKFFSQTSSAMTSLALLLTLTACSSNTEPTRRECEKVAGTWIMQAVIDDAQCGGQGRTENYIYTVMQNNCQLTIAENGAAGIVNGSSIHWPASTFPSNNGTVEMSENTTKVQDKKLSSTLHWNWHSETQKCSGTTQMNGYITSVENTTADNSLYQKWTGTWGNNKEESVKIVKIDKQSVLFNYYWAADPASGQTAGSALIKGVRRAGDKLAFTWQIPGDGKLSFSLNKAQDILTVIYENGTIYGSNEMTQGEKSKLSRYSRLLSPAAGGLKHVFSVQAPDAQQVYLAGEMTDWQGNILKMTKDENGIWSLPLYLAPGAWQYKFVIDGKWIYDKANPNTTDDGYKGYNSMIVLGEDNSDAKVTANIPHGSVETIKLPSQVLGKVSPFMIYLPPQYKQNPKTHYPVLFLLHGYGNNEAQWTRDGKIENFMDNYLYSGWIHPFIIVMPFGDTSQYMGKYETHIIKEVKGYVEAHYRVQKGKTASAISGMSMGGFGAFYLAWHHQDLFGLSVPLSGFFNMRLEPELNTGKKITMAPELHLYCGKDDHISFVSNEALVTRLNKDGVNFTYKTAAGGHTWRYWNSITKDALKVISDYFDNSNSIN